MAILTHEHILPDFSSRSLLCLVMLGAKLHTMVSSDQLGFSYRPLERRIWSVRDLVSTVRTHIDREYGDVWVEGEISNFRAHDSGHLYFTLKDQNAQIRAVMFRSSARLLRFRPDDGMQIVLRGRVTIYEDRGELQISATHHGLHRSNLRGRARCRLLLNSSRPSWKRKDCSIRHARRRFRFCRAASG